MAEPDKATKPAPIAPPPRPAPPAPALANPPAKAGPAGGNGAAAQAAGAAVARPPAGVIDLQGKSQLPVSAELGEYIKQQGSRGAAIPVRFGKVSRAGGTIQIASRDGKSFRTVEHLSPAIPIDHEFLAPLATFDPQLRIRIRDSAITGWAAPNKALNAPDAIDKLIVEAGPALGLVGFDLGRPNFQNAIEAGVFKLGTKQDIDVRLAGWVGLKLGLGLENDAVRLSARGDVQVRGLGKGALEIKRDGKGVTGSAEMAVELAKFSGKATATYANGAFSISGTLAYSTDKLRGSVTVVVMEAAEAEKAARAQIDPQNLATESTKDAEAGTKPEKFKKGERGIAGWGELDFAFTDWFTGKAKAIFGPAGYITIIGKIAPPKSIELMGERPYNTRLFGVDITARYGLPYVADVHVGIGVALGAVARIGPAVLTDIAVEGVYSTDPKVLNAFSITGAFRISAYAGLNLRFEGKAGLTLLGHDIDFGAAITGTAGVKGYAEARPTLGYREKEAPDAGKKGEYFLKGHLEIAAQPFVALDGELFVKLDSPWWSPAPDKTWTWPLFSLEYPLPGEFGVGADIDYVIGSNQWPEIKRGKADFDASKFTDSLLDRQIPAKKVGGDVQKPGTWKGEATPPPPTAAPAAAGGAAKAPGTAAPKAGSPAATAAKGGQKPEEARNVPKTPDASRRWLEGMKALGQLHDHAEKDPEDKTEIHTHLDAIKKKFGFTRLEPQLQGDYWVIDAALNSDGKDSTKQPTARAKKAQDAHADATNDPAKAEKRPVFKPESIAAGDLIQIRSGQKWMSPPAVVSGVTSASVQYTHESGNGTLAGDGIGRVWRKHDPAQGYKTGAGWEAIKDLSAWAVYNPDARQTLNYRYHQDFNNPAGMQWHHIHEQSANGPNTVENLALTSSTNNQNLNVYFAREAPTGTGGLPLRQFLKGRSAADHAMWGRKAIAALGLALTMRDNGRGPFQELQ